MAVGRVYDGAVAAACAADAAVGVDRVVIPVVGECDDCWLNDARAVQVETDDAVRAITAASSGTVAEGCVGAGAGMIALDWKAGIGTSSRLLPSAAATLGVLVLANFSPAPDVHFAGIPLAESSEAAWTPVGGGPEAVSPSSSRTHPSDRTISRASRRRCGLGLARTGSVAHHGSGEIFLAVSTAPRRVHVRDETLDEIFMATVDATEEAVFNALWAAVDTIGRDGRIVTALPHEPVLELLERHGRLDG